MESQPAENSAKSPPLSRSPELMNRRDSALLVVDAQVKLLAIVPQSARIVWNIRRLLDAANALGIPTAATVQYPEKLGHLVPELSQRVGSASAKLSFSAGPCGEIFEPWRADGVFRVLVCGIETHVCVMQSALDLAANGYEPYVAVDAVGARHAVDHETALRRMESAGVVLTTTEAAMFEWCRVAGTPEFKQISALAKESPP
jgi:nicotinamidase-related amidase